MNSPVSRRRIGRVAVATAAALVLASCSGDDADGRTVDFTAATAIDATEVAQWGNGFAASAYRLGDDTTAVVTGSGVFVTENGSDDDPSPVDSFDQPRRFDLRAISADRTTLAILDPDASTLASYDLAAERPAGTAALDPAATVSEMAFFGGGDTLVTTSGNGLTTWNLAAGTSAFVALDGAAGPMAATADAMLVPVLQTGSVAVVTESGVEVRTLDLPDGASVLEAQTSSSGGRAAIRFGEGPNDFDRVDSIQVVEPDSLAPVARVELGRMIDTADWALSDDAVAVAEQDLLTVHPLGGDARAPVAASAGDQIRRLVSIDGGFATVHVSGAVVTWSSPTWEPVQLGTAGLPVSAVDVLGDTLTTVDVDGGIIAWNVRSGDRVGDDRFAIGEATAVAFSPDGSQLGIATTAGRAYIAAPDLAIQETIDAKEPSAHVDTIAFDPSTENVLIGLAERRSSLAFDDTVQVWDRSAEASIATIGGEAEDVPGCSFYYNRIEVTPDGDLMTAVSHDFTLSVYDARTGAYVITLASFENTILDTSMSQGGDLLVAAADDGTVAVFDLVEFEEVARYRSVSGGLQALEILPDDSAIVATDLTGRLITLDLDTGAETSVIAELGQRTKALATSIDGSLVAAPTSANDVGIWTIDGARVGTLDGMTSTVNDVAFSPADDMIAVAERSGTVRTWELVPVDA